MNLTTDLSVRESFSLDASGLHLVPEAVARPGSPDEALDVLRQALTDRTPVTAAGGQTSTTGSSISDRGILLSLRGLDRILDIDAERRIARVQPGVIVADLAKACAAEGLLFAPDPTSEETSTVGGAVATNASGARTLLYGPTRPHVRALRVALGTGEVVEVRRTRLEKNTAGYHLAHDPVDWFVGSEGTLGVVLEIEFGLLPRPTSIVGLALPFATEGDALAFIVAVRGSALRPRCLEYFDPHASAIFAGEGFGGTKPPIVYLEEALAGDAEPDFDAWLEIASAHAVQDADVAVYADEPALRAARRRRHSIPATMDELGMRFRPAGGRRVSTDWAVPYTRLPDAVAKARSIADERGIELAVTYGHAGNGHPHQNFVARDAQELERILSALDETLRWVVAQGGTVSAEHGIGKIKQRWLPLQLSTLQMAGMRALKRELDPHGLLAPGNVL